MSLRQFVRLVAAVPVVAPWTPMVVAGAAGLLLVGFGNAETGGVVFDLRLSGAAVAATTALVLDDPAAATLASAPTTLLARRGARVVVAASFVAGWWCAAAGVARARLAYVPAAPLLREVVVLTAVAVLGSITAQRWSDARGGSAGAFVAGWWFVLSLVPRVGAMPLPPQPMRPGTAGPLLAVTGLAVGVALLVSRDPASPRLTTASSRPRRERDHAGAPIVNRPYSAHPGPSSGPERQENGRPSVNPGRPPAPAAGRRWRRDRRPTRSRP